MSRLVGFFDACLREEGLRDLRFRSSDASPSFVSVELDAAALLEGRTQSIEEGQSAHEWVSGRRVGYRSAGFYLGFPVVAAGDPPEISPLLYVPVDVETGSGSMTLTITDAPQVNYRILEDGGFSTDEAVELAGTIESRLKEASEAGVGGLVLEAIREIASVTELVVPGDLELATLSHVDLTAEGADRVQSAAILFASDRLGFTQSTRRELEALAGEPARWGDTALDAFITGKPTGMIQDPGDLVVVSPLSEAQRRAVKSALSNALTVVTGPPGTGKSELVLNLVANGLARGETVMVASRNNKAIDVVVDRFRGLTDEATMVRVGRASYRGAAVALMRRVVDGIRPPSETEASRAKSAMAAVGTERARLVDAADQRAQADATCDRLESEWERFASVLGAEDAEITKKAAEGIDREEISRLSSLHSTVAARAAGQRGFMEKLVAIVRPQRPLRATQAMVSEAATRIPWAFAPANAATSDGEALVAMALIAVTRVRAAVAWRDLTDAIHASQQQPTLEAIGAALFELSAQEAAAGRRFVAIERQRALSGLPHEDEKKLSEYLRAVDQLSGTERLGSRMYSKLKDLEATLFADVQRVFPVWALTTLTARSNLPLEEGLFDLLIVDEASQCDLPSAFPLLARAKRVVVIGDDKQLIHVTTLRAETEQALAAESDLTPQELVNYSYRQVSLFTLARHMVSALPAMTLLDEHYRSHPQIIGFSNDRFYGGRLNVFTEPDRLVVQTDSDNPAVRWEHVAGLTVRPGHGSAYNEFEVDRVVDVVNGLIGREGGPFSIGVVTPFRMQKERVTTALARRIDAATLERYQITVDTAHGFQGDERDVIVFSTVISAGALPGTVLFVDSNPNIFNVAVTRARSLLIVVGDEEVCRARDGLLGDLAKYAAGLRGAAQVGGDREPETDEERLLLDHLLAAGVDAKPQFEVRGLRVDIAVPAERRPLAIEVDGSSHDSADGSRLLQDVYRDTKLRRAGWDVLRVAAWRVRLEPGGVVADVQARLGGLDRTDG